MANDQALLRDRISGSLYGLLVGDALGCPVEGMTQEEIEDAHGSVTEMVEPVRRWRPAGLHSDDGQQALALADALLEDPDRLAAGFARALVALLEEGPKGFRRFGLHRGTGANFRQTVMALKNGRPLDEASLATAGNGAAMRIAPVALYHRDDDDALLAAVIEASRVTHKDVRGVASAGAVAFLVKDALLHDGPARALATPRLVERVRALEEEAARRLSLDEDDRFSRVLEEALAHVDDELDELLDVVAVLAREGAEREVGPLDGYALASVTSSILLFLRGTSFEETVVTTVNLGGDADTTGAMVGQLAGALYGRRAIPARWLDALVARGVLEDRIDALLERRRGFSPGFSLTELERPWTALSYSREAAPKSDAAKSDAPKSDAPKSDAPKSDAPKGEAPKGDVPDDGGPRALSPTEELMAAVRAERAAAVTGAPSSAPAPTPSPAARADDDDAPKPEPKSQLSFFDLGPRSTKGAKGASPAQPSLFGAPAPGAPEQPTPPPTPPTTTTTTASKPPPDPPASKLPPDPPASKLPPDPPASKLPPDPPASKLPPAPSTPKVPPTTTTGPLPSSVAARITLLRGDITEARVDAIVNAANSSLSGGGGVDGAIHKKAGPTLRRECEAIRDRQGGCRTGDAVMTGAGDLAARHVIHAVGPRWRGGHHNERALLEGAYEASLELAKNAGLRTVAFPSISTGVYAFPVDDAARIALSTIARFLSRHEGAFDEVRFVLFSDDDLARYRAAYRDVVGEEAGPGGAS